MNHTSKMVLVFTVVLLMVFVAGNARADWDPGDPDKMHYPQLPDPTGWDVLASYPKVLADDWQCTGTGPVSGIHLWGSWREDQAAPIEVIYVDIYANIPASPAIDPSPDFPDGVPAMPSRPGDWLWGRDFIPDGGFTVRDYGQGPQGYYNPNPPTEVVEYDHDFFHQINIVDIPDPFIQEEGGVYWLSVCIPTVTGFDWGWKTTQDHFMDAAVWSDFYVGGDGFPIDHNTIHHNTVIIVDYLTTDPWTPLADPITGETLDLAFVITPEPVTLSVLTLGLIPVLFRRRR